VLEELVLGGVLIGFDSTFCSCTTGLLVSIFTSFFSSTTGALDGAPPDPFAEVSITKKS
jgi:hypothetical protein